MPCTDTVRYYAPDPQAFSFTTVTSESQSPIRQFALFIQTNQDPGYLDVAYLQSRAIRAVDRLVGDVPQSVPIVTLPPRAGSQAR